MTTRRRTPAPEARRTAEGWSRKAGCAQRTKAELKQGNELMDVVCERPRIAATSRQRLEDKIREVLKGARGRSLTHVIAELTPILRGWMAYFRLTETNRVLEELDGWLRRKLRCILWRQWKHPYTRAMNLMKARLTEERAWRSACNQRGAWWNTGASHMNQAFPKSYFDRLGLVPLLDMTRRLQCVQ